MNATRLIPTVLAIAAVAAALASPLAAAFSHGECCSTVNGICISACRQTSCDGNGDCKLVKYSTDASSDNPGSEEARRTLGRDDQDLFGRLLAANDASKDFPVGGVFWLSIPGAETPATGPLSIKVQLHSKSPAGVAAGRWPSIKITMRVYDRNDRIWVEHFLPYLEAAEQRASRIEIGLRNQAGNAVVLENVVVVFDRGPGVPVLISTEWVFVA